MAQTRRRTKHRGNAAGSIEARGRTGRKPDDKSNDKRGSNGKASVTKTSGGRTTRSGRPNKPPSWKSALPKAAFMVVLLFVIAQLGVLGKKLSIENTLLLCAIALGAYVPLTYFTDRAVYRMRLRRESGVNNKNKKR
jgi:hypothetical protein